MNKLIALAYVSSASKPLSEDQLEALLLSARAKNESSGISGALLYHDGSFFQYLEGPESEVDVAFARIKASHQHHGIIQLLRRPVESRHFEGWHMGFAHAPKSVMLKLSQASWISALSQNVGSENATGGIHLLLEFWKGATRRK